MREQRVNSGVLFKNNDKQSTTHPDWKGTINVNGVEMWLNAWIKEGKAGKFFSVAVKEKQPKAESAPQKPSNYQNDLDDEIPF